MGIIKLLKQNPIYCFFLVLPTLVVYFSFPSCCPLIDDKDFYLGIEIAKGFGSIMWIVIFMAYFMRIQLIFLVQKRYRNVFSV